MFEGLFEILKPWHWWMAAIVMMTLEVFAPGVFFMWLGLAAGIVGIISWLIPDIAWEWQVLAFAFLAVVSALLGRKWLELHPIASDQPFLNRRGEQYIGRTFTLSEPIVNGLGKIVVDDSTWRIQGTDCPAGAMVKVSGVDGVVLIVEGC